MKFIFSFLIPFLLLLGLIYVLVSAYAIYSVTHPTVSAESIDPSSYFIHFEGFTYKTKDTLSLPGWFGAAKPSAPVIILCHGYGETRSKILGLADKLHGAGFSVVLPLLRGHSADRGATTLGWLESDDLLSMVEELKRQKWLQAQKLGAWGMNTGTFTILAAFQKGLPLKAVAVDTPFLSVQDYLNFRLRQFVADQEIFRPWLTNHLFTTLILRNPMVDTPALNVNAWKEHPKVLVITTLTEKGPSQKASQMLAAFPDTKVWKIAATRQEELSGPMLDAYDQEVVRFFQQVSW